jgi:Putative Flp pilus-assembly TadE/G-like
MLREVVGDRRGGISILTAFVIVGVIGCAALALEYGNALLQQVEDQRVADLAAYSGALVYNATGSTSSTSNAVGNMASLNGLSSASASASVGNSPTGDGNQAVQVTVSTSVPLLLARVITNSPTIPVKAAASAEIKANAPGCIIALASGGSGISLSGTGSITADDCRVESNSSICADSGANPSDVITTQFLSYDSGPNPKTSSCTISPPTGTSSVNVSKASASDPLAGNSEVSGAVSRISTVSSITSPSAPSVPNSTTTMSFPTSGVATNLPTGCTSTYNSSTKAYTVTCTGTATFGTFSLGKNVTVTISTSSGNTYNFSQAWPISGVTLAGSGGTYGFYAGISTSGTTTFPAGTYNIIGGITTGGGTTTTFGAGTYNIGATSCNGTSGYSICNLGTSLTFDGPNTFVLAGGIYNHGGASLYLGSGSSSNSYDIGKASDSNSINVGTSQIMSFGDATGSGDVFETAGTISSGGGSCLVLPAASEHDINGDITGAGGVVLGAGIYTVNGYINFGGGGGDVSNCPTSGTTTGLTGLGVTLVVSGTSTVSSCGSSSVASAFCLGSGYDTVKLTAPSSGSTASLAVIGPQSSSYTGAAAFANGASNTQVSGAFYFPNGQIYMSGSATLHDTVDSGACLELIGTQVTSSAGSALGSTCTGLGSGSAGTSIGLVK